MLLVYINLAVRYMLNSAYDVSRAYFSRCKDDDVQTLYGETPLVTFEKIAQFADICEGMQVFELGCGRGAGVFWWALRYHCCCTGVDINDHFIRKAQALSQQLSIPNTQFSCSNILNVQLKDADVIYLYGTAFSDETIEKIIAHFSSLPAGTKVVTVSYALTHYDLGARQFELVEQAEAEYLWGKADVYLQVRR